MFSRSAPRKLAEESDLYNAALRALMRRAYSIHQMREYLNRRAEEEDVVSAVIARLSELNYLDDAKYSLDYARLHANLRRQGRFRIERELRARGVPDRHIEASLDAVFAETDEAALVRIRVQRKVKSLRGPLDQKKTASLYRSLLAAGFAADVIRTEIRRVAQGDAAEAAESAPEPE